MEIGFRGAAYRHGVERAREVIAVADGGRWIWKQVRQNFPGCVEILDFYHATEHLGEIARAWHGAESPKAGKWLDRCKADLLEGRFGRVMKSIRAWKPLDPEHVEIKRQNTGYFIRKRATNALRRVQGQRDAYRQRNSRVFLQVPRSGQIEAIRNALDTAGRRIHPSTS